MNREPTPPGPHTPELPTEPPAPGTAAGNKPTGPTTRMLGGAVTAAANVALFTGFLGFINVVTCTAVDNVGWRPGPGVTGAHALLSFIGGALATPDMLRERLLARTALTTAALAAPYALAVAYMILIGPAPYAGAVCASIASMYWGVILLVFPPITLVALLFMLAGLAIYAAIIAGVVRLAARAFTRRA